MGGGEEMVGYPTRGGPPQKGGLLYITNYLTQLTRNYLGHLVRMRGLPFSASEDDIYQFFYPYVPSAIYIKFDSSRRASGEAEVHFSTHGDAKAVMTKDRQSIGMLYFMRYHMSCIDSLLL